MMISQIAEMESSPRSEFHSNSKALIYDVQFYFRTTMLGERALDLVREAKRSQDVLGPYNEDKVRPIYL